MKPVLMHRILVEPDWDYLKHPTQQGPHLILGLIKPFEPPSPWETVDILPEADHVYDLTQLPYPWADVAVIHCHGMIHMWTIEQGIQILRELYRILSPGGFLWLGSAIRHWDQTLYTPEFTEVLLFNLGFSDFERAPSTKATGRVLTPDLPPIFCILAKKPS